MKKVKAFWNKYKLMSAAVKASLWYVVCSVIQKGISVITTPIFTRLLTTEQYGVYSVYQSWYTIIAVFATLNLYSGVFNNGMLKYEDDRDGFQSSLQGLCITVTLCLFLVYMAFVGFWNNFFGLTTPIVIAIFIECLFTAGISFWSGRQRFEFKYKKLIAVTLLIAVLTPIFGVAAVLLTDVYKTEARIFTHVFVQFVFGGLLMFLSFKNGRKFFSKKYWKFALLFNIPLIPHYLSQTILNASDRIMINSMVGSSEAAIYSVAYSAAMLITIFTQSINNSFVPWTYLKLREGKYREIGKTSNMLLILITAIAVIMMAFAPELIAILAGEEYTAAVNIIPPVAASVFFMFLFQIFGNIEFYHEKTGYVMIGSSLAAILNLILNYFAIQWFGYIAAGYTTLICYIALSLFHYVLMQRVCRKKNIAESVYDIKAILVISIAVIVVAIGFSLLYEYMIVRYTIIAFILLLAFIFRKTIFTEFKALKNK